ncbi:MAG: 3-deoxy-manno-octulosonate cytidylyltransferase [Candidatus Eisenbacteria sp.]|nr:3-deoxy-manno-octulosonate cytidylyltransferase [Candidatus Eisenbacteria bacterium]
MASAADGMALVIPARLEATRFPRKLLHQIAGRSILEWTWRRAGEVAGLCGVWVATDSDEIAREAGAFGALVLRTQAHRSGTDRVGAAVRQIRPAPRWVVNLQGDEPLVDPRTIGRLCDTLRATDDEMVTCGAPVSSLDEWRDPSVVKVVCSADGRALYFSRAPIPGSQRGGDKDAFVSLRPLILAHVGIYGYPAGVLERLLALPGTPLEQAESLEQLRALEAGIPIRVVRVDGGGHGVDTKEDLLRVEPVLQREMEASRDKRSPEYTREGNTR